MWIILNIIVVHDQGVVVGGGGGYFHVRTLFKLHLCWQI